MNHDRLIELCRQGDPQATVAIFREAYRTRSHRLLEIGLAGGFLCGDTASDAKRYAYMLIAAMAGPVDMWESPIWKGVLGSV